MATCINVSMDAIIHEMLTAERRMLVGVQVTVRRQHWFAALRIQSQWRAYRARTGRWRYCLSAHSQN
jgi:ribosomal protein L32E